MHRGPARANRPREKGPPAFPPWFLRRCCAAADAVVEDDDDGSSSAGAAVGTDTAPRYDPVRGRWEFPPFHVDGPSSEEEGAPAPCPCAACRAAAPMPPPPPPSAYSGAAAAAAVPSRRPLHDRYAHYAFFGPAGDASA